MASICWRGCEFQITLKGVFFMVQWAFSLQFLIYLRATQAKTIHVGLVQPPAPSRPSLECHQQLLPPPARWGTGQSLYFTLSPFSQHAPTTLGILMSLFYYHFLTTEEERAEVLIKRAVIMSCSLIWPSGVGCISWYLPRRTLSSPVFYSETSNFISHCCFHHFGFSFAEALQCPLWTTVNKIICK